MSKIGATERELDNDVQAAAEAETSFAQMCCEVNLEHGLVVHTQGHKPVKLLRPHLRPSALSLSALKRLLSETCKGVQEEDLLKGFIPMERRWKEGLHLCLNTDFSTAKGKMILAAPISNLMERPLKRTTAVPSAAIAMSMPCCFQYNRYPGYALSMAISSGAIARCMAFFTKNHELCWNHHRHAVELPLHHRCHLIFHQGQ
jgi:hypothetical protein